MEWKLLTKDDYKTTSWSGGTTTQLAIAPEGAVYADRDFLWRLSSATVELEHSNFTPLPDYDRFLAVLEGEIRLQVGDQEPTSLIPGQVCAFDGGVPVESWGQCVDFNLMVRKGKGQGSVTILSSTHTQDRYWLPYKGDLAIYCVSGVVRLPESGLEAKTGQLLLCRDAQGEQLHIVNEAGTAMLVCVREV